VYRLGAPVAIILSKASTHDSKLLVSTYKSFCLFRNGKKIKPIILSLDKAYNSKKIEEYLIRKKIQYRIPSKKNSKEIRKFPKLKPFRWTVERTIAWLNAFRAIRTCWEYKESNYMAFCR
jgi:hypothetical protein